MSMKLATLIGRRLLAAALLATSRVTGIPTISVKGSRFFDSDGNQFYIKGIVYQSATSTNNYLSNGNQCQIDAKLIAATGANVIRVYSVDPTLNHDACMQAFEDQGIYVLCDMSTPTYFIDRANPQWTIDLRNQFAKVLDGFHQYDNLLGFFAGNEVINGTSTTDAAPAVKAVIADMKAYRDFMQYRKIPIGYASTNENTLAELASFFDCGNSSISADFFGLNEYSWCGTSTFTQSGYSQLYASAEGFDLPIFLSETGCNLPRPRLFTDQIAILGRQMNDRFSGSVIYEWHQETNNYGLANYSDSALTGTPTLIGEYTTLKNQWATLQPVGVKASTYDPSLTRRSCPSSASGQWLVAASAGTELPTLGLSGFTAPGGQSSRSKGASTGSGASDAAKKSKDAGGSAQLGGGAIAGIVVGIIVVLLLLVGAVFFILRQRRAKEKTAIHGTNGHSDMTAIGSNDAAHKHDMVSELGAERQRQELGPAQDHELRAEQRAGELPHSYESPLHHQNMASAQAADQSSIPPSFGDFRAGQAEHAANEPAGQPSEHVLAQRRREMEWLEAEEARMRQQREHLMNQT